MRSDLLACLLLSTTLGGAAIAAPRSIGIVAPAGESTIAYDVNASGQVAVVLENDDGNRRGMLFEKGKLTDLGLPEGTYSDARAINDRGEIIGSASGKDGRWTAFLFDRAHGARMLGTLGGPSSRGMALNQQGDAVGFADTADGEWHAFLYHGGEQLKDLGTLGGKVSYASGINSSGQIVGTASTSSQYRHAFRYDPGQGMVDLGTLGGGASSATAINESGTVAGAAQTKDGKWHAFVHDGQRMVDLGAMIGHGNSFATGINSAGHVVGTVHAGNDERMSFVWRDNKMTLHRGGHSLYLVNAVNDAEQVVGATYFRKMTAATMLSSDAPVQAKRGELKLIYMIALVLMMAAAAVLYRRRYRGIAFGRHIG